VQDLAEVGMVRKRLIIEMGMGIDQHGQEPTVAAARAVRNAIAHNALPGVWEVAGLSSTVSRTSKRRGGTSCTTLWS
jgi:hypothetical protein